MNTKFIFFSLLALLTTDSVVAQSIQNMTQGRSSSAIAETANPHPGHSMPGMEKPSGDQGTSSHHGDSQSQSHEAAETTQVKLRTSSGVIAPQQSISLSLYVQDANGKVISKFDIFQEKLMHLIVVSNDLTIFKHLHPTYRGDGRFDIEITLPQAGNYTLISDYKPTGQGEKVSLLRLKASGNSNSRSDINFQRTKLVDTTSVSLTLSPTVLKAEEATILSFDLNDAASKQPIFDLKPYLGEQGHLVILRQASPLTRNDYVHAHAMQGTQAGKVAFMTKFPEPGNYKLWGQFNRNGKTVTADFWVKVL